VVSVDWIKLDRYSKKERPLFAQLTDQLRESIQTGKLPEHYKLPSSRALAAELDISRNIVILAYEQLGVEGYLTAKTGSGNYVASGVVWIKRDLDKRDHSKVVEDKASIKVSSLAREKHLIDFRSGVPALDLFPFRLWAKSLRDVCLKLQSSDLTYGNGSGYLDLRSNLCKHLEIYRGLKCTTDQIVITSGAAQSFALLAPMLAQLCEKAIIEDPISKAIPVHFGNAGLEIIPISADEYGLQTDLLPKPKGRHVLFVTPSHQFPLGGVLPIQRRIALIRFAQQSDSYIIEDDYDSEFRHYGSPLPPLRSLSADRVIYVGTFSKMLFPALRLGYVVLPERLVAKFVECKIAHDLQCPVIDQLTLSRFIEEGHLRRHIFQMKKIYGQRRRALIDSLQKAFGSGVRILGDATGLHLNAEFVHHQFDRSIVLNAKEHGIKIYPMAEHTVRANVHQNKLIFGYGNLSLQRIDKGVRILAKLLSS